MGPINGPKVMGPIIRAVCQEPLTRYSRERVLVAILAALEAGGCPDQNWCDEPQFLRVWILSDGYMAGQAAFLPKAPPWWIKDRGREAVAKWLADYALGAADRDEHYDPDRPSPEYLPVPGPDASRDAEET